jgi:hypothetical protein
MKIREWSKAHLNVLYIISPKHGQGTLIEKGL